jgi:aspartate aminotransferase-like enzyme
MNAAREPIDFFLPGPVYVREEVRREMVRAVVGHRSAEFRAVWSRISAGLPPIFRTARPCMTATGSSTLLMEAALVSLTRDTVLHLTNGAFSERWLAVGRSLGRESDAVVVPWGEAVSPELLRAALRRKRYEAVALVHNETSTGVIQPLAELAAVVREESDALLLVDTVSSLAAAPVESDAWGLDFVFAGVQKGIAAPPGLTVFTFSERAERPRRVDPAPRLLHRPACATATGIAKGARSRHPRSAWPGLSIIRSRASRRGLESRWQRHTRLAAVTRPGPKPAAGLRQPIAAADRSPTVTCLSARRPGSLPPISCGAPPRAASPSAAAMAWKPDTFRIGHMGEVGDDDLERLLTALDELIDLPGSP